MTISIEKDQLANDLEYGRVFIDWRGAKIKYAYYDAHPDIPIDSVRMNEIFTWHNAQQDNDTGYAIAAFICLTIVFVLVMVRAS